MVLGDRDEGMRSARTNSALEDGKSDIPCPTAVDAADLKVSHFEKAGHGIPSAFGGRPHRGRPFRCPFRSFPLRRMTEKRCRLA